MPKPPFAGSPIAPNSIIVCVNLENVLGPVRIVLERGKCFDQSAAALVDEQCRADPGIHIPDGTVALSFVQSGFARAIAFLCGATFSGLTGFIGMSLSVRGNVRKTAGSGKRKVDLK